MTAHHKIQLIVAIIGLIGVLSSALIFNWDKIFLPAAIVYEQPNNPQDEFQRLANKLTEESNTIGRLLLEGTHPTGIYGNSENLQLTTSPDNRSLRVRLTVSWFGSVLRMNYKTVFEFDLNETESVHNLKVLSDSAIIPIEAQHLVTTEKMLSQYFQ